jgi:hypothetical protein
MNTVEVLEAAKAELHRRGLYHGRRSNEEGVCTVLAILHNLEGVGDWGDLRNPIYSELVTKLDLDTDEFSAQGSFRNVYALYKWNDVPERTVADVINLYDAVIADHKEETS